LWLFSSLKTHNWLQIWAQNQPKFQLKSAIPPCNLRKFSRLCFPTHSLSSTQCATKRLADPICWRPIVCSLRLDWPNSNRASFAAVEQLFKSRTTADCLQTIGVQKALTFARRPSLATEDCPSEDRPPDSFLEDSLQCQSQFSWLDIARYCFRPTEHQNSTDFPRRSRGSSELAARACLMCSLWRVSSGWLCACATFLATTGPRGPIFGSSGSFATICHPVALGKRATSEQRAASSEQRGQFELWSGSSSEGAFNLD